MNKIRSFPRVSFLFYIFSIKSNSFSNLCSVTIWYIKTQKEFKRKKAALIFYVKITYVRRKVLKITLGNPIGKQVSVVSLCYEL